MKDWSVNPYPKANKQGKGISMSKWLWCSSDAYHLMYWGIPTCNSLAAITLMIIGKRYEMIPLLVMGYVWALLSLYLYYKQYGDWWMNKGMTLFDKFLKD